MSHTVERHEFQAEVKQLLDLMVHSLYSSKDVALRELISNASDALDKLRYEQLTHPEWASAAELHIRIEADAKSRILKIIDNGIGMNREEVIKNVGTIAKSGTKEFLKALKGAQGKEIPPELIGQFGVGFYSSFMIADSVSLLTRRAGEEQATFWESAGDGAYNISEAERASQGTTITLRLKPADTEEELRDFSSEHVIKEIVKRYSDFVAYPIRMQVALPPPPPKEGEGEQDTADAAEAFEDATLNSMKAIWDRPKSEVTEDEYVEFYRHISHDWEQTSAHPSRQDGRHCRSVCAAVFPVEGSLRSVQSRDAARPAAIRQARVRDGRV